MGNPVGAVLRSYEQRCRTFLVGSFVVLGLLQVVLTLCVARQRSSINIMTPFIAMGVVFLGMHLWLQLRLHLLTSRRFTWPGYVASQLVAFFSFTIVFAVGWPVGITLLHGRGGIGLTATVLAMFAVIGWCVVTLSITLMMAAGVGYLWLCFGSSTSQSSLLLDRNSAAGAVVLIASVALIILAVYRLTRIDEETPNYNKKVGGQSADLLPKMTGQHAEPRGKLSRFQLLFSPSIEKVLPRSGTQWDRTRRWRSLLRASLWFPLGLMASGILPQMLVGFFSAARRPLIGGISFNPVLWVYLFMSGGFVAISWLQSWRYLDMEFVRPVPRRMLLKDMGLAITIETFQTWLVMATAVLGVWAMVGGPNKRMDLVTEVLAISLVSQIASLVVVLLVMPLRSPGGAMLAHFGTALLGGAVIAACYGFAGAAPWIAIGGGIALLLGAAALLPVAIRRWDVTDLG